MTPEVPVELIGKTDPGRDPDKQVNEDHFREGRTRFGHLAVVCDGMGGHAGGKEASALASATVFEEVEASPDGLGPADEGAGVDGGDGDRHGEADLRGGHRPM